MNVRVLLVFFPSKSTKSYKRIILLIAMFLFLYLRIIHATLLPAEGAKANPSAQQDKN